MFLFKRGHTGYYYVKYKDSNGKSKNISTKCKTKSEALKVLIEIKNKMDIPKDSIVENVGIKKLQFIFMRHKEITLTSKSINGYKTAFKYMNTYFGDIEISQMSKMDIIKYLDNRVLTSSIYAARKDLNAFKAFFRYAQENRYILVNPCVGIKQFKLPEKLPLYFSKNDFDILLSHIDDNEFKNLVLMALFTGMRLGELLQLNWNQIDIEKRTISLTNQQYLTKTKRIRIIPINDKLLIIINSMKGNIEGGKVFSYKGKYAVSNASIKFKHYVKKANINPKFHFHSLRHTFASWLIQSDVSIYYVSRLLGHSNIKTTEIYAHLNQNNLKNAVNVL